MKTDLVTDVFDVCLQILSWYVSSVTLGSSCFISFVASNPKYLSSADFKHFNGVFLQLVWLSLPCNSIGQILSNWYRVQNPTLLRIFWILTRRIPDHFLKGLVWRFHVLRTLISYTLSLLVRCSWGVCWFQNTWSNNPQQWGRFSPVFLTGLFQLLSMVCLESCGLWEVQHLDSFCIVGIPHSLISYL